MTLEKDYLDAAVPEFLMLSFLYELTEINFSREKLKPWRNLLLFDLSTSFPVSIKPEHLGSQYFQTTL